jgi:hypothetical protein
MAEFLARLVLRHGKFLMQPAHPGRFWQSGGQGGGT